MCTRLVPRQLMFAGLAMGRVRRLCIMDTAGLICRQSGRTSKQNWQASTTETLNPADVYMNWSCRIRKQNWPASTSQTYNPAGVNMNWSGRC